jgi:hypothetical protein
VFRKKNPTGVPKKTGVPEEEHRCCGKKHRCSGRKTQVFRKKTTQVLRKNAITFYVY